MNETKFGGKIVGHSENFLYFRYDSENHCVRKFRMVCEIFAMCNSEFFSFFEKTK